MANAWGKVDDLIVRLGGVSYPPVTGFLVTVAGALAARGSAYGASEMISTATRNGALLGAVSGALVAIMGTAVHPVAVVISAAALGAALGARLARPMPGDFFAVRVLLAGTLAAFAVTGAPVIGLAPSILVGLIAGLMLLGAAVEMFRASPARGNRRA